MNCFLVLGTPRSGSSLVAGILHRLGSHHFGEFLPADVANPTGFYEDLDLVNLLGHVNFPRPARLHDLHVWHHRRNADLPRALQARCAAGVDWGVKSLDVTIAFELFARHCPCPIKIVRMQCALEKSRASARRVWGNHKLVDILAARLEQISPCLAALPTLEVDYDALLAYPLDAVVSVATFTGHAEPAAMKEALAFVQPSLRNIP